MAAVTGLGFPFGVATDSVSVSVFNSLPDVVSPSAFVGGVGLRGGHLLVGFVREEGLAHGDGFPLSVQLLNQSDGDKVKLTRILKE